MNLYIKRIFNGILLFFLMLFMCWGLLQISYSLNNTIIRERIYESYIQLKNETTYYRPFYGTSKILYNVAALDNFTDAIILNVALDKGKDQEISIQKRALLNIHYRIGPEYSQISNLGEALNEENEANYDYSRYWFGIETIVRPLLMIFNLQEIRYINMIFMFCLFLLAFYLIGKKTHVKYSFAFAISVILINFCVIPMTIQFTPVMIIMLLSIIIILEFYENVRFKSFLPYMFVIIGTITSFMDLLTYPLITLAFPLIVIELLEMQKNTTNIKRRLMNILKYSTIWALSYSLFYVCKWIIAGLVIDRSVIDVAVGQLEYRLNISGSPKVNRLDVIKVNVETYFNSIVVAMLIIYITVWIILLLFARNKKVKIKNLIPLLVIMIYPFLWYCAISNHSAEHPWMTYKILSVTMFTFLISTLTYIER